MCHLDRMLPPSRSFCPGVYWASPTTQPCVGSRSTSSACSSPRTLRKDGAGRWAGRSRLSWVQHSTKHSHSNLPVDLVTPILERASSAFTPSLPGVTHWPFSGVVQLMDVHSLSDDVTRTRALLPISPSPSPIQDVNIHTCIFTVFTPLGP